MRTLLVVLMLAVSASYAQAQDAATQAAQQAMQQAQQAAQSFQQAAQTPPAPLCCNISAKPKFSLKAGTYDSSKTVKITDRARGAIIYYTTDGWTPTTASNRYMGPIPINSTTKLQAIAVLPYYGPYGGYYGRSFVVSAQYTIIAPAATSSASANPAPSSKAAPAESADGKFTLPRGTPVPLVFATDVNSKTASVGDPISFTLADDLKAGNVVVVPKGSLAAGLVIQADKTGPGGGPGDVTFQVDSLTVNGSVVKLRGFATKEGEAKPPSVGAMMIPVVGPFTVLKHGTDAEIKQGTPFVAFLDADTSLPLAK